ncbi:NDP-sugar synthase [Microbacterium lacticum]|uniref:nucleotidyltransferase family protein n=1 Tax=Microbacterium lacticum TaxID=33885 RepID=UPI001F578C33|nr:NDP-sugar synthase [Microbacterium lacticum]
MTRTAGVVLAAGAGRRLRPISNAWPKPLTPVLGRTLLDRAIDALHRVGAEQVLVNTHVGADRIEEHLRSTWPRVRTRREAALSGPAGALRCFRDDLASYDEVLVVSGDALFDDPLEGLLAAHRRRAASLTFGTRTVRQAHQFGVLDIDEDDTLLGAREKPDVSPDLPLTVSAGIYALRPEAIDALPSDGVADFVPDLFPALQGQGATVLTHPLTGHWFDVGSPAALHDAIAHLLRGHPTRQHVDTDAIIAPDATLHGWVAIERGARIGRGAWVQDSVMLPGAEVPDGAFVIGGVLGALTITTDESGGR